MKNVSVMNLRDYGTPITMESLFGKDANRISKACKEVMNDWLHPYAGCYHANRLKLYELREMLTVPAGSNLAIEGKKFLTQWYAEHPEEAAKERASRKKWENERDRKFRIVYGIAKRHGFYLKWHGQSVPCCGDEWEVYKNHKAIARICCL